MTKLETFYGVLDTRLENRDYLIGNRYSIADLANFNIVEVAPVSGIELSKFPNVQRWASNIERRPAVGRGQNVPQKIPIMGATYYELLENSPEFKERERGLKDVLKEAKKQFDEPH